MKSVFLSWDEPACRAIAKRLHGMENASSCLILVPTREAARQLRLEIALAAEGGAAFAPKIIPVGSFLEPENGDATPSSLAELHAWLRVLESSNREKYPTLFPQGLKDDPSFLLDIAEQMANLRNKLAGEGISFEEAARKSDESDRWLELDELNRRFAGQINSMGFRDYASMLWQEAAAPHLASALQGIPGAHVIMACIPEIQRPTRRALLAAEEMDVPIEIWVHAPTELADQFDSWGCPLPAFWNTCRIALDENRISVSGNPELLALSVCKTIANREQNGTVAIGICDPRMTTPIETELERHGWGLYKPNGRPFSGTGLMTILRNLEESLASPQLAEPLAKLLRSPLLASSLNFSRHYDMCAALDRILETWIPESCGYMLDILQSKEIERQIEQQRQSEAHSSAGIARIENECKMLARAWNEITRWRDSFNKNNQTGKRLLEWLEQVARTAPHNREQSNDALDLLMEAANELGKIEAHSKSPVAPAEALRLLMRQLQQTAVNRRRTERDTLDALGWLELSFCPEQHLIITGLNEGIVPEGRFDDIFLPESLRENLGTPSMKDRTARDSFLLASLVESRKNNGSVSIALSKTTPQNDPLIPSSLLMRCTDAELAGRVELLFGQKAAESEPAAYDRGNWHLSPSAGWGNRSKAIQDLIPGFVNPWGEGGKAFSPSSLKRFLACPLRFWIQTALKLNDSDALHKDRRNMLPAESGTLMHKVLEIFARKYPSHDPLLDEKSLKCDLSQILDAEFRSMFGDETLLPLIMQKASLEQRLSEYAVLHLADLREGWECIEFERQVRDWTLEGFPMNFRIDRIDHHRDGRIRVVDYKTGKAEPCEKKHLKLLSEEAISKLDLFAPGISPCPALFNKKHRPHRWIDLQLPIYALWASEAFQTRASASYYAIPSNKRDIRRYDWETLDNRPEGAESSVIESARSWAAAAMNLIQSGLCTASSEELGWGEPPYDLFADLKVEETIQQVFGIS